MKRIAVIGSGISGVILGQKLSKKAEVTIFEKAKSVGGRMSTRYADKFAFDHGAQCFTARTSKFKRFISPLIESGLITEWKGDVINLELGKEESSRTWYETHLVASPNMNSLCKTMAEGLNIKPLCEVASVQNTKSKEWELADKEGNNLGTFDLVISTLPPTQTLSLFTNKINKNEALSNCKMQSCYSLMLGFNRPWDKNWIAAKVRNNPIKWISVNSSKPGRNSDVTCLVVHSKGNWANKHIDDDIIETERTLLTELNKITGINCKEADYISTHRWRYAIVESTSKSGCYYDYDHGLAATGDWCETSRIEEVWHHAQNLADSIAARM